MNRITDEIANQERRILGALDRAEQARKQLKQSREEAAEARAIIAALRFAKQNQEPPREGDVPDILDETPHETAP